MRGSDEKQGEVFSYIPLGDRIPRDHPLRRIRAMVDRGLDEMWTPFEALYARRGRPSIAPERLLRALLLQALHSIRSETQRRIKFHLSIAIDSAGHLEVALRARHWFAIRPTSGRMVATVAIPCEGVRFAAEREWRPRCRTLPRSLR